MLKAAAVLVAAASLSGCRVMAHLTERETREEHIEIDRQTLSETWNPPAAETVSVEVEKGGLRIVVIGKETGVRKVLVHERVHIVEGCARRAVGGIFEAPDSFWAVCDDVWVCFSFLGAMLFMHSDGNLDNPYVLAVMALSIIPITIDAITFIPLWIAGHDWSGQCDYTIEEHDEGEKTEEKEEPMERSGPFHGAEITVRSSHGGPALGRLVAGADGTANASLRDVIAWSRGSLANLVFEVSAGGVTTRAEVPPGEVLNGPFGTVVDWRAYKETAAPALVASTRVVGSELLVTVENRGHGDAWQVAAIVAADSAEADGKVAALGHIRPGEKVEAHIALPRGVSRGAVDFSEASGNAPGAMPFGE